MSKTIRTFLLGLLALPMAAQQTPLTVSGAVIGALDGLKKVTHAPLAGIVGADFIGEIPASELPVRIGLSYAAMPGKERFGLKTSLSLIQLHGDFFLEGPSKSLRVIGGLSVNKYKMYKNTHEDADPFDIEHHYPIRDDKGLKLGYRLGVEYALTPAIALEVLFQQTELAGKDFNNDPLVRQGGVNPCWLQAGVTYHF